MKIKIPNKCSISGHQCMFFHSGYCEDACYASSPYCNFYKKTIIDFSDPEGGGMQFHINDTQRFNIEKPIFCKVKRGEIE